MVDMTDKLDPLQEYSHVWKKSLATHYFPFQYLASCQMIIQPHESRRGTIHLVAWVRLFVIWAFFLIWRDAKWDPSNAFPWSVNFWAENCKLLSPSLRECIVVVALCSGMGATNFISRDPTNFSSHTIMMALNSYHLWITTVVSNRHFKKNWIFFCFSE